MFSRYFLYLVVYCLCACVVYFKKSLFLMDFWTMYTNRSYRISTVGVQVSEDLSWSLSFIESSLSVISYHWLDRIYISVLPVYHIWDHKHVSILLPHIRPIAFKLLSVQSLLPVVVFKFLSDLCLWFIILSETRKKVSIVKCPLYLLLRKTSGRPVQY